jgi:hypothetical protein|uniref:Uncharacterized protein n=1 Tax=viral metagenome TaxID=1070528 RepID=A0A6C0JDA4_9ZZZZ
MASDDELYLEILESYKENAEIIEYLKSLNESSKQSLLIAYQHLGSSFDIYRSCGFTVSRNNQIK